MPAEIFPQSLRSKGVAYSTVSNWTWNFVGERSDDEILQAVADEACSFTTVGLITPVLVQRTGYGAFAFFAVWGLLSMIWVGSCTSPPTSTM